MAFVGICFYKYIAFGAKTQAEMQDSCTVSANIAIAEAKGGEGVRIVIDKARRRLVLRQGRRELYRCRIQLGVVPVGAKQREGDGKTPEGRYSVCSRNPQSKYYRALGVSYPNERDACQARDLDAELRREIISAARKGQRPRWDTPLGGWIMIHGQPGDGRVVSEDWTAGCIAVQNADMDALWRWGYVGLRVLIRK